MYASRHNDFFKVCRRFRRALGCRGAGALMERAGTLRYPCPSLRGGFCASSPENFVSLLSMPKRWCKTPSSKCLYANRFHPQEGASFSSWAYTILNRVAYTKYRVKKVERDGRIEMTPEQYESLPDVRAEFLEDLSLRNEVIAALAKLPETAAKILRAQFIEGKSQEEIAVSEHLSIPAVKTRIHRAKKLFKKIYDTQRYD